MTSLVSAVGVTLIGGAEVSAADLQAALALAPTLIAADGGADRALDLGHRPAAVVGDLDSISDLAKTRLAKVLHPIGEQDSTDFEKCLTHLDAPFVIAVGFTGGRMDHQFAVMNTMARLPMPPVLLLGEEDICFRAPPECALELPVGTRLSLVPMGLSSGRSAGLQWPIDGIDFAPDGRIGTSNRVTGPVRLLIDGAMLVILPRDMLARAARALFAV